MLRFVELKAPRPGRHEVLVQIYATAVSAEDPKMRAFEHPPAFRLPIALLYGYPKPRRGVWGMEFAGVVAAVGRSVTRFIVGERVFGYTGVGLGAYAQYRCVAETGVLAAMPPDMSFVEAAAMPNGALTALAYLRNLGHLRAGETALVYGASGAVGTAAVQLAKALGAKVVGVCSRRNVELVESLGAEHVIDYTAEDYRQSKRRYDVVFDTVGRTTMRDVSGILTPNGRYLVTVFSLRDSLRMLWSFLRGGQRMIGGASNFYWKTADLELLSGLFVEGKYKPVIDRTYPWTAVAEAHRYVEGGHKRGNVVMEVEHGGG